MTSIAVTELRPSQLSEVSVLLESLRSTYGSSPLSEQFELGLSDHRLGHRHLIARVSGDLSGVLCLDESPEVPQVEIAVADKDLSVARSLLSATGFPVLDVWSHGAAGFPPGADAEIVRELLVMTLSQHAPSVGAPEGFSIIDLVQSRQRWGAFADSELIRVNNEAFSWHPEQGNWDVARWERAQEAEWFDPAGVLLLWEGAQEGGRLAGFHWTKCLKSHSVTENQTFGEVYVVGLAQSSQGKGLGRVVTLMGINHIQNMGRDQVILYVEADNSAAVRVYEKLGFTVTERHILYRFSQEI